MATPAVLIERKKAMQAFGSACGLAVPANFSAGVGTFGAPATRFLREIQRELRVPETGVWGPVVQTVAVRQDVGRHPHPLRARRAHGAACATSRRSSSTSCTTWRTPTQLRAAEETGSYFESRAAKGSAHFGTDDDSIEQYLPLNVVPWGAPGANVDGVHLEQMGLAAWSTAQWFTRAAGTLMNTAWVLAYLYRHRVGSVPLRVLSDAELRAGLKGVVTHRQITRVLGGGTHTDPGPGYPLGYVLRRAHVFAGI